MPSTLTAYRILIELRDDLVEERRVFAETLHAFNETDGIPRGALFVPLTWETGAVFPTAEVSRQLQTVDCFMLALWDRWPAGAHDEFELAMECLARPDAPMSRVITFFKPVPPRILEDPGDELRKVLDFRARLESDRTISVEPYETLEAFAKRVRWHLGRMLAEHEQPVAREDPVPTPAEPNPGPPELESEPVPVIDGPEGWPPHPRLDNPEAMNEFGLFLQREGMLEEAESLHQQALDSARERGEEEATAVAHGNLGVIYQRRRELPRAEEMFRIALEIAERLDKQKGVAACYSGLGHVARARDDLDEAERMFRQALEIEKALARPEGMVASYRNLGLIHDFRGETEEADKMRRIAEKISEEPEYPRGGLFPREI